MIFLIIIWVLMGLWTAHIAKNRNRNQVYWGIAGVLFGIFAVLIVFLSPTIPPKEEK